MSRGPVTVVSATVGTAAVTALASNTGRVFLQIQNVHATQGLQYTLDGSTPVLNGQGNYLSAGGSATYDTFVPTGSVLVIGSAAGTAYTINWM